MHLRLVTTDFGLVGSFVSHNLMRPWVDRPSGLLIWRGSRIVVRGGRGDDAVRQRVTRSSEWLFVVVIDAGTGEAVTSHQTSRLAR